MRFIHTADWHLGRIFHGVHLTSDQAHVLEQLIGLARDCRPDAVVVSGDIYDRAVPPPEAVALLDDVLSRLVLDVRVPVILIAGNHDSPDRLGFASRLLAGQGLHVVGALTASPARIPLRDAHGAVHVYALPYAEPAVVRERFAPSSEDPPADDGAGIRDHDSAMRALMARVWAFHPKGERAALVAHAFVLGGEPSESERPLSVGGAGAVDGACFHGFHYVAAGHLHRAQRAGDDRVQYAGSLLKYAFSEASHAKSVQLVEMDAEGGCAMERIELTPRRDVRCIEGTLKAVLKAAPADGNRDDYLLVRLLDREPILDAMGKLRAAYPNVLHIERPHLSEIAGLGELARRDHRRLTDEELFAAFFAQATEEALTGAQAQAFATIVEAMRRRDREAAP